MYDDSGVYAVGGIIMMIAMAIIGVTLMLAASAKPKAKVTDAPAASKGVSK